MRRAGVLPNSDAARRFLDYLDSVGIEAERRDAPPHAVAPDDSTNDTANDETPVEVFIVDEDQVQRGRDELAAYLADPNTPRFAEAAREAESVRRAERLSKIDAERADLLRRIDRLQPWWTRVPGVLAVMTACLIVGMATANGSSNPRLFDGLKITQAAQPDDGFALPEIARGEFWRLVTPALRHFGTTHLLINLIGLFVFGQMIERRRGTRAFLTLVALFAVVSSLTQFFARGPEFGGLSGVVCGLFGYAAVKSLYQRDLGIMMPREVMFLFVLLYAVGLVSSENFANGAHFGGLLAGLAVGFGGLLLDHLRWKRDREVEIESIRQRDAATEPPSSETKPDAE